MDEVSLLHLAGSFMVYSFQEIVLVDSGARILARALCSIISLHALVTPKGMHIPQVVKTTTRVSPGLYKPRLRTCGHHLQSIVYAALRLDLRFQCKRSEANERRVANMLRLYEPAGRGEEVWHRACLRVHKESQGFTRREQSLTVSR